MVASPPESDAIMPGRSLRSRAYQAALEPESPVTMQPSGSRGDSSQNTRCGLSGSASFIARASSTRHQRATLRSTSARQRRSGLGLSKGSSARSVSAQSPTRLSSIG